MPPTDRGGEQEGCPAWLGLQNEWGTARDFQGRGLRAARAGVGRPDGLGAAQPSVPGARGSRETRPGQCPTVFSQANTSAVILKK